MLKLITNDFYNISNRIKKVFENYKIFYDTTKKEFYVFSVKNNKKHFEFCIGNKLNNLALKKAVTSSFKNFKAIFKNIEQTNLKLERQNLERLQDYSKDNLNVYLSYASRKNKDVDFSSINKFRWI